LILRLTAGFWIIHLIRNTFQLASKKYWDQLKHDAVKPICAAVKRDRGKGGVRRARREVGERYPAIIRLWDTRGRSSSRSSTTTWRSAASSARRTGLRA
jgi:transposase-like protein